MLQTVRKEKVHEKNGTICLAFMFFSLVMVLKLSKKVHCLQFSADFRKKFNCNKAIYLYAFERSRYALSENGIVYCAMNFSRASLFFDILFSILWTVAQAPINQIIFYKNVVRNFRCIYVHRFNRFRFLAEVSIQLQITHFLNNLRAIT